MAEKTFKDILTKISNVFKTDMYVVNWRYCFAGDESEKKNPGTMICVLEQDESDITKNTFPNNKIVFFKNIKKYKNTDGGAEFIKTTFTDTESDTILMKMNQLCTKVDAIHNWKPFDLSEEELEKLLVKKSVVGMQLDSKYSFILSSQLLPLATKSNASNLSYNIIKEKDNDDELSLVELVLKFDHPMFIYYNFVYYLNVQ